MNYDNYGPKKGSGLNMLNLRKHLLDGHVIPALPLALDDAGRWSERHQKAILRYYYEAGAGGIAVGVHSTQFEIRLPEHGLFEPVLKLASEVMNEVAQRDFIRIAGLCGETPQARREAEFARETGYHAGLLSLGALKEADEDTLIAHCRDVASVLPVIGFYLQPAVGGRLLSHDFWRRFAGIENVVAVKIAPFNRYQTLDVVRAVLGSGREDLAMYTGNDDNIIVDLLTPFRFEGRTRFISGGLLGQWGVWTARAVEMLDEIKQARRENRLEAAWLSRNAELTDANAAVFDVAHNFAGCIPGILEVLRGQGLAASSRCLNPAETLSPGQAEEIERVRRAYPELLDDAFVAANLDRWLA